MGLNGQVSHQVLVGLIAERYGIDRDVVVFGDIDHARWIGPVSEQTVAEQDDRFLRSDAPKSWIIEMIDRGGESGGDVRCAHKGNGVVMGERSADVGVT